MGIDPARVAKPSADAVEEAPSEVSPPSEMPAADDDGPSEEVEALEREEIAREDWLETPEAIQEREESRSAFDDLPSIEAQSLLGEAFREQLDQLEGDPARLLSDLQIEEVVGEYGALVPDGDGGSLLVESPIPIQSQVPGEEGKPVDLSLKESEPGMFEVESPAAEIRLPASLGGEIEIGKELAISRLPGEATVQAARYGDKDLFLANTATDTDTFIAPLTHSVEVFEQLRSPKSPEQFRFGLSMPEGGTLRSDGFGGAEILNAAKERIGFVPAPYATDAQGSGVPASMEVEGDSLVVNIEHRSLDLAYPILLDPELVTESWYWTEGNTFGLGYWGWQETADYENGTSCTLTCWGYGLYARSKGSNHWYGANTWGRWVYTAPNWTAYIARAVFWTLRGNTHNCYTHHPHGWIGLWNGSSYSGLGVYSPPNFSATSWDTNWVAGTNHREAHIAIGTGSSASQLACGHDFYVGGATIYQDDPENPTAAASGMPSGWITDGSNFTVKGEGGDVGLGVRKITFTREGSANSMERPHGCNGTAASRCPYAHSEQFTQSAG